MEPPPDGEADPVTSMVGNESETAPSLPDHPRKNPGRRFSTRTRPTKAASPLKLMAKMRKSGAKNRKHLSPERKVSPVGLSARKLTQKLISKGKHQPPSLSEPKPVCGRLAFEETSAEDAGEGQALEGKEDRNPEKGKDSCMSDQPALVVPTQIVEEPLGDRMEVAATQSENLTIGVDRQTESSQDISMDQTESVLLLGVCEQTSPSGKGFPSALEGQAVSCEHAPTLPANNQPGVVTCRKLSTIPESWADESTLDLMAAQPLQPMNLECSIPTSEGAVCSKEKNGSGNASTSPGLPYVDPDPLHISPQMLTSDCQSDFPLLSKGHTKRMCQTFEKPKSSITIPTVSFDTEGRTSTLIPAPSNDLGTSSKTMEKDNTIIAEETVQMTSNAWKQGTNEKKKDSNLAQIIKGRKDGAGPVAFDPDKIKKLGIIGESSGLPSIYFTGSDTDYLAARVGHAIVGKFSHSIPTSQHIQKALNNINFVDKFSWRYINAKHIVIQLEYIADYATMLNGPNGMPVWFVDRHPMRVCKWTPEFDPFFESPIVAVWCNIIGLPIHLFESSALFAIGSLFGNPIQVDQATINRERYSFARICIEIDITNTPSSEFVLDIRGREQRLKVKWDRIPLYCGDCRHVGHSSEKCYAFGKGVMPAKKDYNTSKASLKQHQNTNHPTASRQKNFRNEPQNEDRNKGLPGDSSRGLNLKQHQGAGGEGISNSVEISDNEGFQTVGRRRGKHRHRYLGRGGLHFNHYDRGGTSPLAQVGYAEKPRHRSESPPGSSHRKESLARMDPPEAPQLSHGWLIPHRNYFKQLENRDLTRKTWMMTLRWKAEEMALRKLGLVVQDLRTSLAKIWWRDISRKRIMIRRR